MRILIFSHKNDIDGMGSVVLSRLAFTQADYTLCETFDLNHKVSEAINTGKIHDYDRIFITDLCPDEEILKFISSDEKLKDKIRITDHHKTYDNEKYTVYPFVNVKIRNEKGICCATSLFYEYLTENGLLKGNKAVDEFVELTRLHDTWEWKNIYNNEKARELAILFDALGTEGYINFMYNKLSTEKEFIFNELEKVLISNKKVVISDAIEGYLNNIHHREILDMKAGIVFINYEFRNELAEYLRENKYDIDFVMMISPDRGVVSYRSIKPGVSVRKVAEFFGGKGHDAAATNPITAKQKELILNILTEKN